MKSKYVDRALEEQPPSLRDKFDTITKVHGSRNTIVKKRQDEDEKLRKLALAMKGKTLKQLEKEAIATMYKESELLLDEKQVQHLHELFNSCKEKETDGQVQLDEICAYISEDDIFNELLQKPVRKPYEGNPENLENLLARMLTDHRGAQISWF